MMVRTSVVFISFVLMALAPASRASLTPNKLVATVVTPQVTPSQLTPANGPLGWPFPVSAKASIGHLR